jgi:hypothetical protein
MFVKQAEIAAAVQRAIEETDNFPHAYDNIEQQIDDTREVTG